MLFRSNVITLASDMAGGSYETSIIKAVYDSGYIKISAANKFKNLKCNAAMSYAYYDEIFDTVRAGGRISGGRTLSRSGERWVGEEGRYRWAPDYLKKKKKKIGRAHSKLQSPPASSHLPFSPLFIS